MDFQLQPFHLFGLHDLLAQLRARVDAGVYDDAAGKGLAGVDADLEALAQFIRDCARQSFLLLMVCIVPRGASSAFGLAVWPCCADIRPGRAAPQG